MYAEGVQRRRDEAHVIEIGDPEPHLQVGELPELDIEQAKAEKSLATDQHGSRLPYQVVSEPIPLHRREQSPPIIDAGELPEASVGLAEPLAKENGGRIGRIVEQSRFHGTLRARRIVDLLVEDARELEASAVLLARIAGARHAPLPFDMPGASR